MPQHGEGVGAVAHPYRTGVFAELDIEHPMQAVFYAPVPAHRRGQDRRVGRQTGQIVAPLRRRGRPQAPLGLDFPQSLAVYDDYASAQKAVDFLSDHKFPVEQCMIVGTDLKRIERITGRLTTGRVAIGGLLSGIWLGLFIGLLLSLFTDEESFWTTFLAAVVFGAAFGVIWALVGYAMTRGRRDFSSVTQVVATKYEVLVEHKSAAQARELLAKLPGGLPDPFAQT